MEIIKNNKTIKLHIDYATFTSKPSSQETGAIKKRFNSASSIKDVTINQLFDFIGKGHTFIPAVLQGGTKNENWIEQQLIGIDVDNECQGDILTIDKAISLLKDKNISPIGYYHTFNSSASKPKFRLLFLLKEPIREADKMKWIIETLINIIPQVDKSCKDLSRLFYGTNQEVKILDPNARITLEAISKIAVHKTENKTHHKTSNELQALIDNFDLLDFMIKDGNEVSHKSGNYTYFKNCKICGHKDCLRYYHDTNTFNCFGANGNIGGNIITYLMKTRRLTYNKALEYFKYNILKQPIPQNNNNNRGGFIDVIQKQVNDVGLNIKINTVDWIQVCKSKDDFYYKVLCPKLETYIKENVPYIFVKSGTRSGILKYFYIDNYYKNVGKEELKGIIRAFIPSNLVKMKDINEVYSLLEASVNFKQIDKINNNPSIINFNNGILDINTGELKAHSPDYLCTIKIPCNYVENAPVPSTRYFDSFINDFTNNNTEVKNLLLQFMGVVISNVPRLQNEKSCYSFW